MGKIGFRKELFGFNREDVVNYIESVHRSSRERENEILNTLDELKKQNDDLIETASIIPSLQEKLAVSEATVEKLAKEAAELNEKREEIERMSETIAKLYLVSSSNAQSVMKSAKESSDVALFEVENTLGCIESTQKKLNALKAMISEATEYYSERLTEICTSFDESKLELETVKNKIRSKEAVAEEALLKL